MVVYVVAVLVFLLPILAPHLGWNPSIDVFEYAVAFACAAFVFLFFSLHYFYQKAVGKLFLKRGYWKYSRLIRRVCGSHTTYAQARRQYFTLPEGRTEKCIECGTQSQTMIMSMFSRLLICPDCKADEMQAPRYADAEQAEAEALEHGIHNFKGVGPIGDLTMFLYNRREERKEGRPAAN